MVRELTPVWGSCTSTAFTCSWCDGHKKQIIEIIICWANSTFRKLRIHIWYHQYGVHQKCFCAGISIGGEIHGSYQWFLNFKQKCKAKKPCIFVAWFRKNIPFNIDSTNRNFVAWFRFMNASIEYRKRDSWLFRTLSAQ